MTTCERATRWLFMQLQYSIAELGLFIVFEPFYTLFALHYAYVHFPYWLQMHFFLLLLLLPAYIRLASALFVPISFVRICHWLGGATLWFQGSWAVVYITGGFQWDCHTFGESSIDPVRSRFFYAKAGLFLVDINGHFISCCPCLLLLCTIFVSHFGTVL